MPLSTVTITGSWVTPANTPATGQVVITPLSEVTGGGEIVAGSPVVVPLVGGSISQNFVNNSQAATLQYQVTEQITGAVPVTYVVVPVGSTLDLSTAPRLTVTGATPNPNWPLVTVNVDFTQGPPHTPGASAMSLQAPSRRNAVRQIATQRGRQYELDQIQAGTAALTVVDPLEQLHPSNTASPFNTGPNMVTSYRCCQVGAWWGSTSASPLAGNFLNAANQIPGQPILSASYGWDNSWENWFIQQTTTAGAEMMTSTDHTDGSHTVWKITVTSSAPDVEWVPRIVPGATYTATVDVWAATGQAVTLGWHGTTPATTSITGNGAFQTATITFTPSTADATAAAHLYVFAPSGAYPVSFYVSNWTLAGPQPGWSSAGSPTTTYTTIAPHSGGYHLAVSVPSGAATVSAPLPTAPGFVYTVSAYVESVAAGTVTTMAVGAASSSTTSTGGYQRLSLTFTATDAISVVTWSATGTSYPASFYIDDLQLELANTVGTWTSTGPTFYPIYTGYVETWPIQWDMNGTRGIRPLTCVDALAILSRTEISQSYSATIAADNPYLVIPYNDKSLPQAVQLPMGGQPFLGYQNLGTQGTVNFGGDQFLDGTPSVTVTQQNSNPVTVNNTSYITYLGTINGSLTMNPQSFTIELWIRFTAGTVYLGAGSVPPTETINTEPFGPFSFVGWYTDAGKLLWYYRDPTGIASFLGFPASGTFDGYPDGEWHYLAIRLPGSNGLTAITDNVIGGIATITPAAAVALNNFFIDAETYTGGPASTVSVANLACYPTALSDAQILSHYNRGSGFIDEVSGARVLRLLTQYWQGPMTVAAGKRAMAPDFTYSTRFLLDVIQEIQETERGLVYASASGSVVFEDSATRYVSNPTSKWIFGENPPGASPAEYPYSELGETLDPTYTFSQTNLTRPDNTSFQPLPNPLPTNPPYGQRVLTQEVQVNTDYDLYQASAFYLARYAKPRLRIEKLTLNPAANPALWPVVLSLEISQRITVTRRTSAGLTTSADYYVEQINHNIDIESSTWTVELQCSPVFVSQAWVLGDATYGVLGVSTAPVY